MSKRAQKSTKPKRNEQKVMQKRKGGPILALVLGGATLLGGIAAAVQFFPRLSVTNGSAIDLNDPFSTPFRIVNEGYVPLFSVKFFMRDITVKGQDGGITRIMGEAYADDWHTAVFRPTDGIDLYAGRVIKSDSLTFVELTIVTQYRPFALPIEWERVFQFRTQIGPDNKLHWMRQLAN
ncbi:MAG: hypothetical protein ACLQLH_01980 [Terracidiphilus sp.]